MNVIFSLILGFLIILLVGRNLFYLISKENKKGISILSIGLGVIVIFFSFFSFNQYLKQPIYSVFYLGGIAIFSLFLFILTKKEWIKDFKKIIIPKKLGFLVILIIILSLMVFLKSILLPITDGDAVSMYAFISQYTWENGFPPTPSSAFMEISYAYPNTAFVLFLNNFFYLINGEFSEIIFKVLVPIFGIFNLVMIYFITKELFGDKKSSELAVALSLTTIAFSAFIIQANTLMYELFFILLFVYSFIIYQKEKKFSSLFISSIFLGAVFSIKYTLIPFVILFLISTLLFKKDKKIPIKMVIISSILPIIFYLRNWIFLKNPVFPFVFGGINNNKFLFNLQDSMNFPIYTFEQFAIALVPITLFIIIYFLIFTYKGYKENSLNETQKIFSLTSLMYLIFWFVTIAFAKDVGGERHTIPFIILFSILISAKLSNLIQNKKISFLTSIIPLLTVGLTYLIYFYSVKNPFYEFSFNLLLVLFVSVIMISTSFLISRTKLDSRKVWVLIILSLLFFSFAFNSFAKRSAPWEINLREDIIKEYYPDHFGVFEVINQDLPIDSKILSFFNQRYYLNKEIVPADHPEVFFLYGKDLNYSLNELRNQRIRYILISEGERRLPFWNLSVIHSSHEKDELNLEVIYTNNQTTLYKVY